jgi:hypothetical protein
MIENAHMAATDTQPTWKHRCYYIMEALGADYGDPDWVMPDDRKEVERLRELLKYFDIDPNTKIPPPYDVTFGDDKMCKCGHPYYRHFDTYEKMRAVGCKYCQCRDFEHNSDDLPSETDDGRKLHCETCFAECHLDRCDQQIWWACLKCNKWIEELDYDGG